MAPLHCLFNELPVTLLGFNSDVNFSVKPLAELGADSSLIMRYASCPSRLWWYLSPPLACKLIQHWIHFMSGSLLHGGVPGA